MIKHEEHLSNIKELKLKIAVIYGEVINFVSKDHTESTDWIEIRRLRDNLEKILFSDKLI